MTQDAPKPRQEVVEENHEALELLDLDRAPRPQKLAREQNLLSGADEVSYQERAFHRRHLQSIDEIRAAVDALQVRSESLVAPLPSVPEPAPLPVPKDQRAALEGAMPGLLLSVETVYHVSRGEVVEAVFEHEGKQARRLFLLRDGRARPVADIEARIDALPAPQPRDTAPAPAPVSDPSPVAPSAVTPPPDAEPKKGAFSRFRGKEAPRAEAPDGPPSDDAPKRKFGFGRKKS